MLAFLPSASGFRAAFQFLGLLLINWQILSAGIQMLDWSKWGGFRLTPASSWILEALVSLDAIKQKEKSNPDFLIILGQKNLSFYKMLQAILQESPFVPKTKVQYLFWKRSFNFLYLFIYLNAGSLVWHVGSSSLTRDWTQAPCIGRAES